MITRAEAQVTVYSVTGINCSTDAPETACALLFG